MSSPSTIERILNRVEIVGNKLPDPAALFILLLAIVWALSWALSGIDFNAIDPRTGEAASDQQSISTCCLYGVYDKNSDELFALSPSRGSTCGYARYRHR